MATTDGVFDPEDLVLTIPAEPRYVVIARLFAASAARRMGADEGTIDDIKIVISEAATRAVHDASVGSISVVATRTDATLAYAVRSEGSDGTSPPPGEGDPDDATDDLGLQIIRSLFPSASLDQDEGPRTTLRFSIAVPT